MPVFSYKAKYGPKKIISGTIEAENQDIALSRLDKMHYFVLSITKAGEKTDFKSSLGIFQRINLKHISLFTRQLSDLLDAGVPLLESIDILSKQADKLAEGYMTPAEIFQERFIPIIDEKEIVEEVVEDEE